MNTKRLTITLIFVRDNSNTHLSLHNNTVVILTEIMATQFADTPALNLPVGGSANTSLSVVNSRHHAYLEQLLETWILVLFQYNALW
jgi:hypothetical protein